MKKNTVTTDRIKELKGTDSQEVFAEKIHISQTTISRILNGEAPSASTLITLAKEYGVSVDWLLGLSDRKKNNRVGDLTYADAIVVLDELIKKGSISINGTNPTCFYASDEVLKHLLISRDKAVSLSNKMYEYWVSAIIEKYSDSKVLMWNNQMIKNFRKTVSDRSEDEDIVSFIKSFDNNEG